jgi:hypothetical protein
VISGNVATNHLLCQVTVPKIIGRKRKRKAHQSVSGDSTELPKHLEDKHMNQQQRLVQSIKDNPDAFSIKIIGHINRTHRFRSEL